MKAELFWINDSKIGENRLGTMPHPKGGAHLEESIAHLKHNKVDILVCLLAETEIKELNLEQEETHCQQKNIQFISCPIKDFHTPQNESEFLELADMLVYKIKLGKRIIIHCKMGIGRSSVLAGTVMLKLGFKGANIFETISHHRKLKVPDTQEQEVWILKIENELKGN